MPDEVEVRVSLFPDKPIKVHPNEIPVLRAQGILIEDEPPAPAPAKAGEQKKDGE